MKEQSATGLLAAILIGLLIGGALYYAITSTAEGDLKTQRRTFEYERDFAKTMGVP